MHVLLQNHRYEIPFLLVGSSSAKLNVYFFILNLELMARSLNFSHMMSTVRFDVNLELICKLKAFSYLELVLGTVIALPAGVHCTSAVGDYVYVRYNVI